LELKLTSTFAAIERLLKREAAKPSTSAEGIEQAARQANARDFIRFKRSKSDNRRRYNVPDLEARLEE